MATKQFVESLTKLISDLSEEDELLVAGNGLKGLLNHYPGIKENILENIDAVIINEIQQLNEYPKHIRNLLANNIPVIVVSDRVITGFEDFNLYKNLFSSENYNNSYRFNWDKVKLESLDLKRKTKELNT